MTEFKSEIEKAIEKADYKNSCRIDKTYNHIQQANMPSILCSESFKAGANFLLPVLLKAVEQDDEWIKTTFSDGDEVIEIIKRRNEKLLEMLEQK